MEKIKEIMNCLSKVKGLYNPILISDDLKQEIVNLEENNNLGVRECLNRNVSLFILHDSSFREPAGDIVAMANENVVLPGVGFPEVDGKDVVSSSPSLKVHEFLSEKFNLDLKDEEASLIIGFNLE